MFSVLAVLLIFGWTFLFYCLLYYLLLTSILILMLFREYKQSPSIQALSRHHRSRGGEPNPGWESPAGPRAERERGRGAQATGGAGEVRWLSCSKYEYDLWECKERWIICICILDCTGSRRRRWLAVRPRSEQRERRRLSAWQRRGERRRRRRRRRTRKRDFRKRERRQRDSRNRSERVYRWTCGGIQEVCRSHNRKLCLCIRKRRRSLDRKRRRNDWGRRGRNTFRKRRPNALREKRWRMFTHIRHLS